MSDGELKNPVFKNVTRYATPDERDQVERIELDPKDLDGFMELLKKGLIEAASMHDAAVQGCMALNAELSIRLSRPVYNAETDMVEELVGTERVRGSLRASKVMKGDCGPEKSGSE
ncbi:MAG: hypothetical protein RLO52_29410 [Sandaracinaceae bacterium]|nr:MAG: hypothetical protein EVA89_15330 [Sandaracinaceae bacterium]